MSDDNNTQQSSSSTPPSMQEYMDTILRSIDASVERQLAMALAARLPPATPTSSPSVTGKSLISHFPTKFRVRTTASAHFRSSVCKQKPVAKQSFPTVACPAIPHTKTQLLVSARERSSNLQTEPLLPFTGNEPLLRCLARGCTPLPFSFLSLCLSSVSFLSLVCLFSVSSLCLFCVSSLFLSPLILSLNEIHNGMLAILHSG